MEMEAGKMDRIEVIPVVETRNKRETKNISSRTRYR